MSFHPSPTSHLRGLSLGLSKPVALAILAILANSNDDDSEEHSTDSDLPA